MSAAELYNQGMSLTEIAKQLNTYPNKIRRELLKAGVKMRDKSEAQKLVVQKHGHPTKGKTRSEETKQKIGDSLMEYWVDAPPREGRGENFNSNTSRQNATKGILKAAKDGSSIERYLRKGLSDLGYSVLFHTHPINENPNLEVDIYLPEKSLVIEVDGPSHFKPIWGEEALLRTIKADDAKNGLLATKGIKVLRVKVLKNSSPARLRRLLSSIDEYIKTGNNSLSYLEF